MKRLVALSIVVVLVVAAGAGYFLYARLDQPFRRDQGESQLVDIPSGSSTRAIGERLVAAGVIRDGITFRLALWRSGAARRLKAGTYRFEGAMTPTEVIEKM